MQTPVDTHGDWRRQVTAQLHTRDREAWQPRAPLHTGTHACRWPLSWSCPGPGGSRTTKPCPSHGCQCPGGPLANVTESLGQTSSRGRASRCTGRVTVSKLQPGPSPSPLRPPRPCLITAEVREAAQVRLPPRAEGRLRPSRGRVSPPSPALVVVTSVRQAPGTVLAGGAYHQ